MSQLLRKIAAWLGFYYLLIFIPSFAIEECRQLFGPGIVYIYNDIHKGIYAIGPQYAAYGVDEVDSYPDQIFIVGGSTGARAYDPRTLMKDIPGYRVHNFCLDGPNVTEIAQLVDVIQSRVDLRALHSAIVVLPVNFAAFLDNAREYNFGNATPSIDEERLRHHLYKMSGGRVVPSLPEPLMPTAFFLVRPFIWLYTLEFDMGNALDRASWELSSVLPQTKTETKLSGFDKAFWLAKFEYRGITAEQFRELDSLINRLALMKATVVVVDLPLPGDLRRNFSIYEDYRRHMKEIVRNPAVHYLDLAAWAQDTQFVDGVHPKPQFYVSWAGELARYLKTVIGHPPVRRLFASRPE